jgi:threonine synthase
MAAIVGLECLRCGSHYHEQHYASDCPKCHRQAPSNLVVAYEGSLLTRRPRPNAQGSDGLWRYGDLLPVGEPEAVKLGEGGTPLHKLATTGRSVGVEALFGKDETRNPTW